mgnify:CR=1 FL=1
MAREIHLVPTVGTVQLLQWMKDATEEDRQAMLSYVGKLEGSQRKMAEAINQFPKIVEGQ